MEPARELGRLLLLTGAFIAVAGAFLYFGGRLPFRLGRLPGDVVHRSEHSVIYFPIVTCIVVSAAVTLLFWLVSRFHR